MAGCHDMTNGGNPSDVEYSVSLQFPEFLCDLVKLQTQPRVQICRSLFKRSTATILRKKKQGS